MESSGLLCANDGAYFLLNLPDDLVCIVSDYLELREILALSQTCRKIMYKFDCSTGINSHLICRTIPADAKLSSELSAKYNFRYIFAVYSRMKVRSMREIVELESLNITRQNIIRLSPMVIFRQISKINISFNKISDLSALAPVYCEVQRSLSGAINTAINNKSSKNTAGLKSLWATDNIIADISPVARIKSLTSLNLAGNLISKIPDLSGLTRLESADFSNNQINSLGVLPASLTNLVLSGNKLRDLSGLVGLIALTSVNVSHNDVFDIGPIARLSRLEYLNISENNITFVDCLCELSAIKVINISGNPIKHIKKIFTIPTLEYVYCWNTDVDPVDCRGYIDVYGKKVTIAN